MKFAIMIKGVNFMEEWKDIIGYEGIYKISNLGRVERQEFKQVLPNGAIGIIKKHYIKSHIGTNGYCYVGLCKNNKVKRMSIHRLVAEAFIPNDDNLPEVNHKDQDRQNNNIDNLEWCDRLYNVRYGTGVEKMGISHGIPIERYTIDGKYIDTWYSERHYLKANNIKGQSMILKVCRRIKPYYTAYGYRWKFIGDERPFEPIPIGGIPVYQYTKTGVFIKEYPNAMIASRETNVCYSSIRKCISGKQETAGNYLWKDKLETIEEQ